MLSKLDVAAIRHANDLTVHLNNKCQTGIVRLIKRKRVTESDPFAQDVEHMLTATVELHGMRGQDQLKAGSVQCFAMVGLYHDQHSHASCIFKTLRAGDELTFSFWPDAHTNGYIAMA